MRDVFIMFKNCYIYYIYSFTHVISDSHEYGYRGPKRPEYKEVNKACLKTS